jgi:hypothetical protein
MGRKDAHATDPTQRDAAITHPSIPARSDVDPGVQPAAGQGEEGHAVYAQAGELKFWKQKPRSNPGPAAAFGGKG